jgi:hypothetical protein
MAHHLMNMRDVKKIDCPCGYSRRPFANGKMSAAIMAIHPNVASDLLRG